MSNVAFWVPRIFVPKSTIVVIWYSSEGINIISLPVNSSLYEIISFTIYSSISASSSVIPAFSSAFTKNLEEPSIIGGSDAFISMIKLSISKPTAAANTCSEVWISTPFFSRLVPLWVFTTNSALASIVGQPSKSTLLKAKPWFSGAGLNVIFTLFPVCNPTPVRLTSFCIVFCFLLIIWILSINFFFYFSYFICQLG